MGVSMEDVQSRIDQALEKTRARGLVREPVMVTLPVAILAATVLYKIPGTAWSASSLWAVVAAFLVSFAIYLIDLSTLAAGEWRSSWFSRLGYLVFNTLLLAGLLRGIISPDQLGLSP